MFDSNNVYDDKGNVSLTKVAASDYDLQVPYMLLTGGWATEKDSKWQLKDSTNANAGLPTGKKDYRLVDVKVVYPDNDYFADYKNFEYINKFKDGKPMASAYGEKGGAIMYAQGTSSMEYPVKNLRLRFKNEENWFTVKPSIDPVEIICMKADYMESSGSHNTGAANLVDAMYRGVGIKTPGQAHFGPSEEHPDRKDIVTCIKGHPCLIFYSVDGAPGSYEYIGKYNLNLDKATPEPFGFNHDDSDFGYLAVGEKYYDIQYDSEGEYVTGQVETEKEVQEGERINSIHCFEFLDNAVEVCNFANKYKDYIDDPENPGTLIPDPSGATYSYYDTWYKTFTNKDGDAVPGWTLGFESRYPEDKVGYHDADALYPLASWLNELATMRQEEEAAGKKPSDVEYVYKYSLANKFDVSAQYYELIDGEYHEVANLLETNFVPDTYYIREITDTIFAMKSLERFKREYQCYLDAEFTWAYYLLTEALLMADSRVKNMMIATWGKEARTYVDVDTGETKETNNYIFYPIFYDMDTMLGLDNTGVYRFNYYDEDTDASVYNGDEILWTFVRDALPADLKRYYTELETAILQPNGVLPYFNNNQANMANEAFYNGDSKYKYINPARYGYHDDLYDKPIAAGAGPYLYAA
jgi:hypothetical protein